MAARSIWNGTVTFGAVAIPVKLFSATESHTLSFKEVRAEDGARVSHKRIGASSGEEIAYSEIEKGFDTGSELVILSKEEVSAADGTRPKVIEIETFVKGEEIDPVFYDKAYHLGAGKGGDRAYRVLLAALERSGRVGIGRLVLRSREQLVALRPIHGALGLQTMRFHDELRAPDDLEMPEMKKAPGAKEVEMAGKLVEMLSSDWDADAHHDTYRDAVLELIEAKAGGKDVTIAPPKPKADSGDALAKALEASLAALDQPKPKAKKKPAAKKAAAKTSASTATKPKRSPTDKPGPPAAKKKAS
ncbi:MAG: Ku protein [Solirubrobacteraceae bacterium]|nr:Ku protein [Solirubrobacteraceae bacterium]